MKDQTNDGARYSLLENAVNAFTNSILHAAEASALTMQSFWRPASVSNYYFLFSLISSYILIELVHKKSAVRDLLDDRQIKAISQHDSPAKLITHSMAENIVNKMKDFEDTKIRRDFERLRKTREFTSYQPRVEVASGKPIIRVKEFPPEEFVVDVGEQVSRIEEYLDEFVNIIESKRGSQDDEVNGYEWFWGAWTRNRPIVLDYLGMGYFNSETREVAQGILKYVNPSSE